MIVQFSKQFLEIVITAFFRVLRFWGAFGVSLFLLTVSAQANENNWRCGVDLIFDSSSTGSVANYIITLQIKNPTGRNVSGVSIIYKDVAMNVVGNTHLECMSDLKGIKPGSYGECSRILQKVDGTYINAFGIEKWTEIVNSQLKKYNSVQYCEVLGFSY